MSVRADFDTVQKQGTCFVVGNLAFGRIYSEHVKYSAARRSQLRLTYRDSRVDIYTPQMWEKARTNG